MAKKNAAQRASEKATKAQKRKKSLAKAAAPPAGEVGVVTARMQKARALAQLAYEVFAGDGPPDGDEPPS